MGSLARQLRRQQERESVLLARSSARKLGKKPPPKKKHRKGGVSISTPRHTPVTFSLLPGNTVKFGCPVCRSVLYMGKGSPHEGAQRVIERHVSLCKARQELLKTLEKCIESVLIMIELEGETEEAWDESAKNLLVLV